MANERETKEVKVGTHTIVLYTYATGGEHDEIQKVYLDGAKIKMVGKDVAVEGIKPTAEFDANRKAVELLVVSLDGDKNDIVTRVYNLPHQEKDAVVAALGEATGKKKAE